MIGLIISLAVGAAVGYLASQIMHLNLSLAMCMLLGIVGSFVGHFVFGIIGFSASGIAGIIVDVIGACIVVALARKLK